MIEIHLLMSEALPYPHCWAKQILVLAIIIINIGGRGEEGGGGTATSVPTNVTTIELILALNAAPTETSS